MFTREHKRFIFVLAIVLAIAMGVNVPQMEAISSDDFVAKIEDALESGADTDYADDAPEVAELKRECADLIVSINDKLLPKLYVLLDEAESILAQYPREYGAEIAAIDAAKPLALFLHQRVAEGATIEEVQADAKYQRLLGETLFIMAYFDFVK